MPGLFDTNGRPPRELLQYLWLQVAANNRRLAVVADRLAAGALTNANQKQFDDLLAQQDKLLDVAGELQKSLEQVHVELGLRLPTQNSS